jgi:hypothetical protein
MYDLVAPNRIDLTLFDEKPITVFLAGTIDMGNSVDWQHEFLKVYREVDNLLMFNPRRPDWNSDWEQVITNANFKAQVDWEMDYLIYADVIVFNFEENSKSPITLAELGLHVADKSKHILVRCPKGFYRKGNVDIICQRHNVPVYETMDDIHAVLKYIIHQTSKIKAFEKNKIGQYSIGF